MTQTQKKCNQCGSALFLLEKRVEQIDHYSPVTVKIYRCSNKDCQDDIDKKTLARKKDFSDQKEAKEKRLKSKSQLRLNKKKILR